MTRRRPSRRPLRSPHHRVADFTTLPELIEHAKTVDGASHILVAGRQMTLFFPRTDGRYESASPWQERGYWHFPATGDRAVVTRLPAGAEPIGSHTRRVGGRASEAGRRRAPPKIPGAASDLEWHHHRDSFVGTVDGVSHFLVDPSAGGDWILWAVNPTTGVQTRKLGRYPTAADAKDAARSGRTVGEARPRGRREPEGPGIGGSLQLANELSQQLNGSTPKDIPGGFRWSEHNEAAQFTTHSPEYSQKVVVVVSLFDDASVAVDFFGDEGLSETARYENIGHFTYPTTSDLPEMVKDIQWVWETVDGYAASWQEDESGEVDEARREQPYRVSFTTTHGTIDGWIWATSERQAKRRLEDELGGAAFDLRSIEIDQSGRAPRPNEYEHSRGSKHFVRKLPGMRKLPAVAEARHIGLEPMSADAFIELLSSKLQRFDRQARVRFDPSLAGERGGGSVYVNFINLPPGVGDAGGGAEAENNRASFHIRGFAYDPTVPVAKVKVDQSNNVFRRTVPFRARTGSPEVVARHLSEYLAAIVKTVPPNFTHTTRERIRSRR